MLVILPSILWERCWTGEAEWWRGREVSPEISVDVALDKSRLCRWHFWTILAKISHFNFLALWVLRSISFSVKENWLLLLLFFYSADSRLRSHYVQLHGCKVQGCKVHWRHIHPTDFSLTPDYGSVFCPCVLLCFSLGLCMCVCLCRNVYVCMCVCVCVCGSAWHTLSWHVIGITSLPCFCQWEQPLMVPGL